MKKKIKKRLVARKHPHIIMLLPMAKPLTVNKDIIWFCFVLVFSKCSICCALHDNIIYLYTFFLLFGIPGHLT